MPDQHDVLLQTDLRQVRGVLTHILVEELLAAGSHEPVGIVHRQVRICLIGDRAWHVDTEQRRQEDRPRGCFDGRGACQTPAATRAKMLQDALLGALEALELMEFVEDNPFPKELLQQGEVQVVQRRDRAVLGRLGDPEPRHCGCPLQQALRGRHDCLQASLAARVTELLSPHTVNLRIQKPVRAQHDISLGDIRCLGLFEVPDIGQSEDPHGALLRRPTVLHVTSKRLAVVHELGDLGQPLVKKIAGHDDQSPARGDEFAGVARRKFCQSPRAQRAIDETDGRGGLAITNLVGQDAAMHVVGCRGPEFEHDGLHQTHDLLHPDVLIVVAWVARAAQVKF
mmetsp:Transcript_22617/g.67945  ORF Transcript_22617/g.67945 Transcript_22617/m.67945 type:complete len:340 (+) Transcript_22617:371-1390(+)